MKVVFPFLRALPADVNVRPGDVLEATAASVLRTGAPLDGWSFLKASSPRPGWIEAQPIIASPVTAPLGEPRTQVLVTRGGELVLSAVREHAVAPSSGVVTSDLAGVSIVRFARVASSDEASPGSAW